MMTKTQARKVGKKIKDETYGPIPEYADWERAENDAVDSYIEKIMFVDDNSPLYDFGDDYSKAKDVIGLHSLVFALKTDKGTIATDIQQVWVKPKTWRQRKFGAKRSNGQVLVSLRAILNKGGTEVLQLKKVPLTDVENIADFAMVAGYQMRSMSENLYHNLEKIVEDREKTLEATVKKC